MEVCKVVLEVGHLARFAYDVYLCCMKNVLLTRMMAQRDENQVEGLMRFFKTGKGEYGYGDKFLGIKVPVTRSVVKECWQEVTWENLEECITSEYHEVRLAALLCLVEIFSHAKVDSAFAKYCSLVTSQKGCTSISKDSTTKRTNDGRATVVQKETVAFYLSHTKYINNWDLVDLSCYKLLGEYLKNKDRKLLYDLAKKGKTLWEQRIGMVSTMAFIRGGETQDTFNIALILLDHPHDLIHKAVGWLLREAGKKDEKALLAFLDLHGSSMPRTMLRYAIEKLTPVQRQHYMEVT